MINKIRPLIMVVLLSALAAFSQTTEFTYQGNLSTSGLPATGNYDFEFALFDVVSGGTQIGSTLTRSTVAVSAGAFAVKLDFGNQFPGANRFLEIRVKQTGQPVLTTLTPRQPLNSTPYAVKAVNAETAASATTAATATNAINSATATNALQLGGVAANQYVLTGDARLSDARNPMPNSSNYIQNQNAAPQSSNFNISGTGTASIFSVATQYNIGGNRVLSIGGTDNVFAGVGAGAANAGGRNAFFGTGSGQTNTTGYNNAFFGTNAGTGNSTGALNSFFGASAGFSNTTGWHNAFFGQSAGYNNTTGASNAFFGRNAGAVNTSGGSNAFFGYYAGVSNTIGANNTIIGTNAGSSNQTGSNNTIIGAGANVSDNLNYATAVGAGAIATESNTIVLGRPANNSSNRDTVIVPGLLEVVWYASAGVDPLCRSATNLIGVCSSSARYKNNINSFSSGLSLIRQLRPVTFNWKDGGMRDMGLVAEEVNAVEPLLTTNNTKGEVEGVKYDRVGVVLVNAVKEQQAQIESLEIQNRSQQKQIELQQKQIRALTALACRENKSVDICKEQP